MSLHNSKKSNKHQKFERSPQKSTSYKLSRNLQQDFDQYTLKQQSAEYEKSLQSNDQLSDDQNKQLKQSLKFKNTNSHKKYSKTNFTNKQNIQGTANNIPRSYLLAMENLQSALQSRQKQLFDIKDMLISKQQTILENQTRINQVLQHCQQLSEIKSQQKQQIEVLKSQIKELRIDQEGAVRQAARAMETSIRQRNLGMHQGIYPPQFPIFVPPLHQQHFYPIDSEIITAKASRSKTLHTSNPNTSMKNAKKLDYDLAAYNKQQKQQDIYHESKNNSRASIHQQRKQNSKQNNKNSIQFSNPPISGLVSYQSSAMLSNPSASKSLLHHNNNNNSTNKNFISYQRQIIRAQKQLIALNYRMQCLQRSLLGIKQSNSKTNRTNNNNQQKQKNSSQRSSYSQSNKQSEEENTKKKMRQLQKQIEDKEKILAKLKNI